MGEMGSEMTTRLTDKKANFERDEKGELTPEGWQSLWEVELSASKDWLERWHTRGTEINKIFLDERDGNSSEKRLNLFTSNVETLQSLLYGKIPQASVSRRFGDAKDDPARVAGQMIERVLNVDIEKDDDGFASALSYALEDRLLPGFGMVWLRYVADFETQPATPAITAPCPMCQGSGAMQMGAGGMMGMGAGGGMQMGEMPMPMPMSGDGATGAMSGGGMMGAEPMAQMPCEQCKGTGTVELAPEVPEQEVKTYEAVESDYVHWKHARWSPCRTFHEARWFARMAEMPREKLHERFDKSLDPLLVDQIPLASEKKSDEENKDPWERAEVWEIWSKEHKKVFWVVEGFPRVLDMQDDPLGLEAFWPFPKPMVARPTTTAFRPTPDYAASQDLYRDINTLWTRISLLEDAIRITGVYNRTNSAIEQLVEGGENKLYPVDDWAAFAEKGGVQGAVQFMPLAEIVQAIQVLSSRLQEKISLLFQVSGMSDIMRGAATQGAQATATERAIQAKFASVRTQRFQDDFARFASEAQRIKTEIIAKHFDDATIVKTSNIEATPDAALVSQALELIRGKYFNYRVEVKPESINLTDYAALKAERVEVVQAVGQYLQTVAPLAQMSPAALPMLLEVLKWLISSLKGAATVEGIFDQAIAAAQQMAQAPRGPPQPPPPDPRLQMEQLKQQGAQKKLALDIQAHAQKKTLDVQADAQMQKNQAQINLLEEEAKQRQEALAAISSMGPHGLGHVQ